MVYMPRVLVHAARSPRPRQSGVQFFARKAPDEALRKAICQESEDPNHLPNHISFFFKGPLGELVGHLAVRFGVAKMWHNKKRPLIELSPSGIDAKTAGSLLMSLRHASSLQLEYTRLSVNTRARRERIASWNVHPRLCHSVRSNARVTGG